MTLNRPTFLVISLLSVSILSGDETKAQLKKVKAKDITLEVPASWKSIQLQSKFRAAQLSIPGKDDKAEKADLVVYHFGGPTGGVKANVGRWIGQFQEKGRAVQLVRGKSKQGDYILAEISGTWNKPDGPPFAQKTVEKPGSRVIGVILITENEGDKDYYFLKFSGPESLVKQQAAALRTSFAADAKSEEPFKLDDAK